MSSLLDLQFTVGLIATGVAALAAGWLALERRWVLLQHVLIGYVITGFVFLAVLYTAAEMQRRVYSMQEPQCFEEWCISAVRAEIDYDAVNSFIDVWMTLSNRGLQLHLRQRNVSVYLMDVQEHRFAPLEGPANVPFDIALQPGDSIVIRRRFIVPAKAGRDLVLIVTHEGGWDLPARFRKPPVVLLRGFVLNRQLSLVGTRGEISGYVENEGHIPMRNMVVRLYPANRNQLLLYMAPWTLSGEDGSFSFSGVEFGRYRLTADFERAAYREAHYEVLITVDAPHPTARDVRLMAQW